MMQAATTIPSPLKTLRARIARAWAPPKKMTLSEWSDEYAFMSAESSAGDGKWHTLPYQKGMMDAMTDPAIEFVVVMKSARVGYTKCLNNLIGYHMHQDPCSMMMVQPTVEDAEGYSKEEIAPMLRDTKVLKGIVSEQSAKESANTILAKQFPGGVLSVVGANSPRGFRRVSRRIVMFDEVDGYPQSAGAEGDQIKLGMKRAEYFWNRKYVAGSTPTIKKHSKIEKLYESTDKRRYFVPCPHCGEFQVFKWSGIKWPEGEPQKAYYVCEHSGCIIEHSDKYGMIEKGEWRATSKAKRRGYVGFHIWAAYSYSPNATWGNLAEEFVECKGDKDALKTFINTALGESWEEESGESQPWENLYARMEQYKPLTVPANGLLLTCGVDTQDNRLAVKIKAWGRGEESWLVYYTEIFGDPAGDAVWAELDEILQREYEHASGAMLRITATAIDSGGHHTQRVYAYAKSRREMNVIAVKGSSTPGQPVRGKRSSVDFDHRGRIIKDGAEVWFVGTDTAKSLIYARMRHTEGPGSMHWYIGLEETYFRGLTAERRVNKLHKGHSRSEWVKDYARNEPLDTEVYSLAAAYHAGMQRVSWDRLEDRLLPADWLAAMRTGAGATTPPQNLTGSAAGAYSHMTSQDVPSDGAPDDSDDLDDFEPRPQVRRPARRTGGGWVTGWKK